MEPEGPIRAVRADHAPDRNGLGQFTNEPDDLDSEPQPVTQHQQLIVLGDHRLTVREQSDLHWHHIIQVETADRALPTGQVQAVPWRRVSPVGVPGEHQRLTTSDNTLGNHPLQLRRQVDRRHSVRQPRQPERSDRHIVQAHTQHGAKLVTADPASARQYPTAGDRYRIFAITCPFHGNAGWRWIRDNDPDGWVEAVEFDKAIRDGYPRATTQGQQLRGQYFLHRSCQPLGDVDLDPPATTKRHLRLVTTNAVEEDDPDGCSPWSCRSGTAVAPERAA